MPRPLGLVYLSIDDLVARAGADPWKLNDELQSGDPGAIDAQADAFHRAATSTTEFEDDFNDAKQRFERGWRHNKAEHPINESPEVTRATTTLHLQKSQLGKIALDLENVAGSLATAQRDSDGAVAALDGQLHQIDDAMEHASLNNQNTDTMVDEAVSAVKLALRDVQDGRARYVDALAAAKPSMDAVTEETPIDPGGDAPAPVDKPDPNNPQNDPAGDGGGKEPWWKPSPSEVAIGGAGVVSGVTADGVRQATLNAIKDGPKTGPGAADPALVKWLDDPKYRTLNGFSKIGGVASLVGVMPSIASDMHSENGKPGDSFAKAATREAGGTAVGIGASTLTAIAIDAGAGLLADAAAGAAIGSIIPGAGTAVGLVAGAVVGAYLATDASKLIGEGWDAIASGVESLFS